ncbi:unnamed protein product [Prorocentrum cordatum]|uniref:Copper transporter n=1 Tax=Prorocentrum cordatum TaxID=2364126 RepID=A0ABN9QW26_9DINO|nr:unnamed protein product [Polarella glacialis]
MLLSFVGYLTVLIEMFFAGLARLRPLMVRSRRAPQGAIHRPLIRAVCPCLLIPPLLKVQNDTQVSTTTDPLDCIPDPVEYDSHPNHYDGFDAATAMAINASAMSRLPGAPAPASEYKLYSWRVRAPNSVVPSFRLPPFLFWPLLCGMSGISGVYSDLVPCALFRLPD